MKEDYYSKEESVKEYIQLSKDVNGEELILELKNHLSKNSSILEIGSGPGTDWKILKKDFKIVGSDNSKEFLNHLTAKYPEGEFMELDAISLNTVERFDAIYSNKVLHHLTDEELTKSIQNQLNLLKSNGLICHSFWKGEGSEVFKGLFVNYHTIEDLKGFFKESFELVYLKTYKEFEENDSILIIGKKK